MALLDEKTRNQYLKELGYGSVKDFQKAVMYPQWVDGVYGVQTDNALRTAYNVHKNCKNFVTKEFMCECGGRFCGGYPDFMKPSILKHIQTIRDHYGVPIDITSGLRCKEYNAELNGSAENSGHLKGLAVDFYQRGVTDTLGNRKSSISYIRNLPNHKFSYGQAMYGTDGLYRSAAYMGNAMHTETYNSESSQPDGKLNVDGIGGYQTIKALQKRFNTPQDGIISGQNKALGKYYPNITAVQYGYGGSKCVAALQRWAGCTDDGIWGQDTSKAVQKKLISLNYSVGSWGADGIFGADSVKALQRWLNGDTPKPVPPTPTDYYKMIDVSEFQSSVDWAKVKADGVKGVIVRCGGRGGESGNIYADAKYMEYIKGAHAVGLPVGIYFLTQAVNSAEGKAEAEYTIRKWAEAGIPISYPICIDSENVEWENPDGTKGYGRANDRNLSKSKRTEAIKGFCDECARQGYKSMLYASLTWLEDCVDMSKLSCDVWVAQYYTECQYKGKYIIWQYTSNGKVNGIPDVVDLNRCYVQPKAVNPPKHTPQPYSGDYPTAADIRQSQIGGLCRACREQSAWSYGSEYGFENNPTIERSRFKSTCVTYVSCVMQRIKVFASGECLWHDGTGYGDGKVRGANSLMTVTYHDNKPLSEISLQTGDVVFYDDNKSGEMGNGGHEEIFNGTRNGTHSFFFSGGTGSYHNTSNNNREPNTRKVLATVRLKPRTYLQFGDDGEGVKKLQNYLLWFGCDLGKWGADGVWGEDTEAAVGKLQQALGVEVDYLVGNDTLKAMKAYKK